MSSYLESSKFTPNVAIYERLGFRLVQEMTLNHDGDTCNVFMIRDPKGAVNLESSVSEEVATGEAAERGFNGGVRANK